MSNFKISLKIKLKNYIKQFIAKNRHCTVILIFNISYFLARKTHHDFFVRNFRKKNNDECILILVIYWKKTGLLHTKISNHNIIYSSQKPRKSSLPLKSSSWLFSLDAYGYKSGNNTYPQRIRHRLDLGHIFQGKKRSLWAGNYSIPHHVLHTTLTIPLRHKFLWRRSVLIPVPASQALPPLPPQPIRSDIHAEGFLGGPKGVTIAGCQIW